MMCWGGDPQSSNDSWLAIAIGLMLLFWIGSYLGEWYQHGLPPWFPEPVSACLILGLAACGLFALAVAWRRR